MAELNVHLDLRMGKRTVAAVMSAAMLFSAVGEVASESVTLTTYYPAPSGVYTQMITTGNTYLARDYASNGSGVTIGGTGSAPSGGLAFGNANPTIQAGSYIIIPNGLYVNVGTAYFQQTVQARNGIHNDSGANLDLWGGTSGNTQVDGNMSVTGNTSMTGSLTVNNAVISNGYLFNQSAYTNWATYGTGAGGAAIYNDGNGYKTLMIVGNASAGHERRVGVWDSMIINGAGAGGGNIALTDNTCAEVQYNIDGFTTCAAAGYGGATYATWQSGVISQYVIMPYYTNGVGATQGGLAPFLCCACPASGCPL